MAQRLARICLFTSFLFSQFLITSQVEASVLVLIDAHRDLEEIESLEAASQEVELQFASQFDAERFGDTECQLCGRTQLSDEVYDGIPLQEFGLRSLKTDAPPTRRTWAARESALGFNTELADLETIVAEPELNVGPEDAIQFHGRSSRPAWEATSRFLAAQRSSFNEVVYATRFNVEGFCSWADQQIEFAQAQTASEEWENSSPVEHVAVKESSTLTTGAETPVVLVPGVEPIETRQIPMFQIVDTEEGPGNELQGQAVALKSIASVNIPMFFVADIEAAQVSNSPQVNPLSEVSVSNELEAVDSATKGAGLGSSRMSDDEVTKDGFINEAGAPRSIESRQPDRDPYWEYYEDCDRWGVGFAKLIIKIKPNHQNRANLTTVVSPFLIRSTLAASTRLTWVFSLASESERGDRQLMQMWREMLAQNEFRLIEEQQHQAILFRPQPQSPFVAALLLGKPLCYQLDIGGSDLVGLLSTGSLSWGISELQLQYAGQIQELLVRSEAMRLSQRSRSLSLIATRCRQLADSLDRLADSISAGSGDVATAAGNGKSVSTK